MTIAATEAAQQTPELFEKEPLKVVGGETGTKIHRDISVAARHLNKRRDVLLSQKAKIVAELDKLDAAILALE